MFIYRQAFIVALLFGAFSIKGQEQCKLRLTQLVKFNSQGDSINCIPELMDYHAIEMTSDDQYLKVQMNEDSFCFQYRSYQYNIEGMETGWSNCGDFFQLGRLPNYGQYKLLFRCKLTNGIYSNTLEIPIIMVRPFSVWWYYIGGGLLLLALIVSYFKYLNFQLQRRNEELEKTVNLKTNALQIALKEKELLLSEIHHRVKNNLSVISALLDLQQRGLESDEMKKVFDIAKLRVRSVGLIHQLLYQNNNFGEIDVEDFSIKLFTQIKSVFGGNREIVFHVEANQIALDINNIIPIGLILNEMMTNSFKYAFHEQLNPEIQLSLSYHPEEVRPYVLHYKDNGIGLLKHSA
jgi:two-component sensor histidine kinase